MPTRSIFSICFFFTGFFALLGGLYTWGSGWIFSQVDTKSVLVPLADVLLAGPLSLIASWGIYKSQNWGDVLGLLTSGMFLFGSVQVYILIAYTDSPILLQLCIPPLGGICLSVAFATWFLQQKANHVSSGTAPPSAESSLTHEG